MESLNVEMKLSYFEMDGVGKEFIINVIDDCLLMFSMIVFL